ncbi:MAG: hypothetical protein RIR00_1783 [Pseudomonadota bacterium]|jgi:predicted PurR-regulated permease PerM
MENRHKVFAQIAVSTLLLLGGLLVLAPFIAASLFAAVVCISTWPIYARLLRKLNGRASLTASLMTLLLLLLAVLPTVFLSISVADVGALAVERLRGTLSQGLPAHLPDWVRGLPLFGEALDNYWHTLASNKTELQKALEQLYEPARQFGLKLVALVAEGVLQLMLVVFIAFFLYRDGPRIAETLTRLACRLGQGLGVELLQLAAQTVTGVMIGLVGTAVAQAMVALLGFLLAGVPAPLLLAAGTFFLSMVPIGPPLLWGGAAWWLSDQGETGWAIFMVLWGLLAISSVDNFLKPILISRSASLPILLIALGVFGGALAFGFIGIFLGPALLALGLVLLKHWARREALSGDCS